MNWRDTRQRTAALICGYIIIIIIIDWNLLLLIRRLNWLLSFSCLMSWLSFTSTFHFHRWCTSMVLSIGEYTSQVVLVQPNINCILCGFSCMVACLKPYICGCVYLCGRWSVVIEFRSLCCWFYMFQACETAESEKHISCNFTNFSEYFECH